MVVSGAEVKSLRGGRGSLAEAYARVRGHEIWLEGMHIPPYEQAMDKARGEPLRPRHLLPHRKASARARAGKAAVREAPGDRRARAPARDGSGVRPAALGDEGRSYTCRTT